MNRVAESKQIAAIPNASDWKAIRRLQRFTIICMTVEAAVALFAALHARSVALAAFGGDSTIELFSAAAVLWRFHSTEERAEATATKITGWFLVALALLSMNAQLVRFSTLRMILSNL